jgi:hypothetical protein
MAASIRISQQTRGRLNPMKPLRLALMLCLMVGLGTTAQAHDPKAPLNKEQKIFLAQYELARAALAADDLQAAKEATAVSRR